MMGFHFGSVILVKQWILTKIISATSTVWISNHWRKKHQPQKPSSTPNKTISSSSIFIRGSAFLTLTLEQLPLFKLKLITCMVKKHISYNQVKDENFRKFVARCSLGAVSAETLLPRSRNTIRSWILDGYCSRKAHLCGKILSVASSVIHIFFDLWTSPNNSTYIDVIAYFLDVKKELHTMVLAVCNINRDLNRGNQAEAIIPVMDEYGLKKSWAILWPIKLLPMIHLMPRSLIWFNQILIEKNRDFDVWEISSTWLPEL